MLKKFILLCLLLCVLTGTVGAEGRIIGWYGTLTAQPETIYVPTGNRPLNIEEYTSFGFIFETITYDTCVTDSVIVELQVSDTWQCSTTTTLLTEKLVNDQARSSKKWFLPDSIGDTYWFEEYFRLRIRTTIQTVAHIDTCVPDADEGTNDWSNTASDGYTEVDEDLGSEDTTTSGGYVFVTEADSFECFTTRNERIGRGYPDSVVIYILANDADSIAGAGNIAQRCSLDFGVCIGDTGDCHWNGTIAVHNDTIRYSMVTTTCPSTDLAWNVLNLDSILIALKSVHVDTVAAGDQDWLKVFQAGAIVYWDNDTFYDRIKWKARIILKE